MPATTSRVSSAPAAAGEQALRLAPGTGSPRTARTRCRRTGVTKCVHSPSRVPGSRHDAPQRVRAGRRAATIVTPGRRVAQADGHSDRGDQADPGGRRRTSASSRPRAAGDERERGDDLPGLPEHARSAGSPAGARRAGNQRRDQPQHADERHRVAGADEHPGREPEPARCRRSPAAAARRPSSSRAGDDHAGASRPGPAPHRPAPAAPRTPPSWSDTEAGDSTAGADTEALLRVEAGDAERGAVEDRHRVREDAESPHHPGPPRNRPHDSEEHAALPSASETRATGPRTAYSIERSVQLPFVHLTRRLSRRTPAGPVSGTRPASCREVPARPFARISTVSSWPLPLSASARCRSRDPTARGCGRRGLPGRTIRAFRTPGLQRLSD